MEGAPRPSTLQALGVGSGRQGLCGPHFPAPFCCLEGPKDPALLGSHPYGHATCSRDRLAKSHSCSRYCCPWVMPRPR